MRFKVTVTDAGGRATDIAVDADAHATIGELADWISEHRGHRRSPGACTLAITRDGRDVYLPRDASVDDSGVRSGDRVSLGDVSAYAASLPPRLAVARVIAGPDAGAEIELPSGSSTIGRERDCAVRLSDPLVSKRHARINVTDVVEIVDTNSANGVIVAGGKVARAVVTADDAIVLGDTTLVIRRTRSVSQSEVVGAVGFNRSPRLDPEYPGATLVAPEPPIPPHRNRLPISMLVLPIVMGVVLYLITQNIASVVFIALSPLLMIGSFVEQRTWSKRDFSDDVDRFHDSLADLVVQMQKARETERAVRAHEHPGTADVVDAALSGAPLLWVRRPDRRAFLEVRLGLGSQPSRSTIELPMTRNTLPELWNELQDVAQSFRDVDRVPVVGSLPDHHAIGIGGPDPACADVARGVVGQVAALHSPAEVLIAAIVPPARLAEWSWLKWLPHTWSEQSPVDADLLCSSGPAAANLCAGIEGLIASRLEQQHSGTPDIEPAVVLLVDEDAPIERSRLVEIAEQGPPAGVYTIWTASTLEQLPAVCRRFLAVDHATGSPGVGTVISGDYVTPVEVGRLSIADAEHFARALAPLVDLGAAADGQADLPRAVSFVLEMGQEVVADPGFVADRWIESHSVAHQPTGVGARDRSLRAFVGSAGSEPLALDLRSHGPHALVGGTTGAGKSEFLQTWLASMATTYSPERVNFLLVDYKGGSAFGACANLPHAVGLVTDLTPRLVRRALISLRAEITRRERVLQQWRAKDLSDLEAKEGNGAPVVPSLVIVVDEFAALIQEVPEFVDGMIDIAQRGRSLGLHLILATQRPAGVIKGNLRANTNLRIALRMADSDDSLDVVGTTAASEFDPSIPGRALAKTGPGKVVAFQSAYVGGWTTDQRETASIAISELPFGTGLEWERDEPVVSSGRDLGPRDLDRVVTTVTDAFVRLELAPPARPWLPQLADRYEVAKLPTRRTDRELVFAVRDEPELQAQVEQSFRPDEDGNIAAFGTGGSGKSTFLRTLAIAAGLAVRDGRCVVYGVDFGARGLGMLEKLPHVGAIIGSDDDERIARLFGQLRETVDERARSYARVGAGSIGDYRRLAAAPDEQRVLLLVDGAGAFRQAYELGPRARIFDQFMSIATDGRQVGVHVALTADRPSSIPAALLSAIPRRLVLRTADEMDLAMMGVPMDAFDAQAPPGRGYLDGAEVQVAVLGGSDTSVIEQARAVEELAQTMQDRVAAAPTIERLPERVMLSDLPVTVGDLPVLGVADATLEPIGFAAGSVLTLCGPPESGKTLVTTALVESLHRCKPDAAYHYFGNHRSPLAARDDWSTCTTDVAQVTDVAERLTDDLRSDRVVASDCVIVLETVSDFLNTPADDVLQDLLRVSRATGATVIVTDETAVLAQSWPLFKEARASRHGIALQPDQMDGDNVFSTSFGRMQRADFPPGRGMYVRAGKAHRVQFALPE